MATPMPHVSQATVTEMPELDWMLELGKELALGVERFGVEALPEPGWVQPEPGWVQPEREWVPPFGGMGRSPQVAERVPWAAGVEPGRVARLDQRLSLDSLPVRRHLHRQVAQSGSASAVGWESHSNYANPAP